jgi:hypothetical protein
MPNFYEFAEILGEVAAITAFSVLVLFAIAITIGVVQL